MKKSELTVQQLREIAYDIGNRMEATVQRKLEKTGGPRPHDAANWASEVDHPCERFLVYARTHWRERKQKDIRVQARLDAGIAMEDEVEEQLRRCGYKVKLQQYSTSWEKYQLRGRIDGFIVGPDKRSWPMEITSVMPWYWESTRSIEAVKNHAKHWIRRKVGQLNIYLLLENQEGGFLVIGSFGKLPRVLPMLLDYDMAEEHIQKCIRVNEHVASGTLPPRIEYTSDVCGLCDFEHICQPLQYVSNLQEITPEDYKDLQRYLELQEAVDEYKALERKLVGTKDAPGRFYGANAIHHDVEISTRTWKTKVLDLPPAVRQLMQRKYQRETTASRTTINFIGGNEDE